MKLFFTAPLSAVMSKVQLLEQHQQDAERHEQLASLNAEQAKAIARLDGAG
ncbi:hypothetical protein [Saccharothrix syringae]|uniref:hypothetical protein n=1 Tax=Saccharothrix syringae TaxID=103733 RepID=UPI001292D93C|nr:hypothetical protein [Saccharothrix syringae]